MPKGNSNYRKGRNYEYELMRELQRQDFDVVLRSAGSHSIIDVIGINSVTKEIILYQAKTGKNKKREIEKAKKQLDALSGFFTVHAYAV